jgi:hypothetical protein
MYIKTLISRGSDLIDSQIQFAIGFLFIVYFVLFILIHQVN